LAGVFVNSSHRFRSGQMITLAIPDKHGKDSLVRGRVVWSNENLRRQVIKKIKPKLSFYRWHPGLRFAPQPLQSPVAFAAAPPDMPRQPRRHTRQPPRRCCSFILNPLGR
jgi:hypothetical protein